MGCFTYVTVAARFRVFERSVKRLIEIQSECDPEWLQNPINWLNFYMSWKDTPVWVAYERREDHYSIFPCPKFGQGGEKEWSKRGFEIKIFFNHKIEFIS